MSDERRHDQKECPACSAFHSMAGQVRDMAEDHRDAWLYGIVLGWEDADDPDSNTEIWEDFAVKHGWSKEVAARLRRLRARYVEAFPCQRQDVEVGK